VREERRGDRLNGVLYRQSGMAKAKGLPRRPSYESRSFEKENSAES
jgi:hypothetical protein